MSTSEVRNLNPVPTEVELDQHGTTEEDPQSQATTGDEKQTKSPGRDRSTVVFPYDELSSAETVARTIFKTYGDRCTMDQLAGQFNQKTTSGAFRIKVTGARIFGLVTVSRQSVALTERGQRILDEQTAAKARVDAFLGVPLYLQLYERFKGKTLPPGNAPLEGIIREMGVAPKQVGTARWRFQKSAETAGFFDTGRDRLVMPALGTVESVVGRPQDQDRERDEGVQMGNNGGVEQHPLMIGLIQSLPAPGDDFPTRARDRWLNAVRVNFDFIYGPADETDASTGPRVEDAHA